MVNKRLEELAEQAGFVDYMVYGRIESKEDVLKNFAELIVRECANYAFSDDQEHKAMLKHFGVE